MQSTLIKSIIYYSYQCLQLQIIVNTIDLNEHLLKLPTIEDDYFFNLTRNQIKRN